jgi:hypothetical protein
MHLFWRLVLAHFLADFTFQADFIAAWKRRNVAGGVVHSLIFLACSLALTGGYLFEPWPLFGTTANLPGWAALLVLSFLHFLEDEWRVWTIQKRGSPDNLFFFLWDQFIHLLLIFLFFPTGIVLPPEPVVFLAILGILVTHFSSIFIFYLEKEIYGFSKIMTGEKYYSMAERLVTGLALLLPGWAALSFLAVWLARIFWQRRQGTYGISPVNIAVGNILAVVCGIAGHIIYYG